MPTVDSGDRLQSTASLLHLVEVLKAHHFDDLRQAKSLPLKTVHVLLDLPLSVADAFPE
ncbi:hypothetical protein D3C81_2207190 [compost metagenome]